VAQLKKKGALTPFLNIYMNFYGNTGCGKLTSFFEYEMPYEEGS
jgi:hypothetical protein